MFGFTMPTFPSWVTWAALAVLVAFSFGSGWHVKSQLDELDRLRDVAAVEKARAELQVRADNIGGVLEQTLTKLHDLEKLSQEAFQHELQNPVYRTCIVPADGVRSFNSATTGR